MDKQVTSGQNRQTITEMESKSDSSNAQKYESVGLETVRERRACVSVNCERSTRVYTVDDEDIRSSGLVQVNDGLYAEVPNIGPEYVTILTTLCTALYVYCQIFITHNQ
jgi:hypothetical protein